VVVSDEWNHRSLRHHLSYSVITSHALVYVLQASEKRTFRAKSYVDLVRVVQLRIATRGHPFYINDITTVAFELHTLLFML